MNALCDVNFDDYVIESMKDPVQAAACGLALKTEPLAQFVWLINSKSYGCETLYWWLHGDRQEKRPTGEGWPEFSWNPHGCWVPVAGARGRTRTGTPCGGGF